MGGIVVAVNGSADSKEALLWALEEARLRGVTLEIVHPSTAGSDEEEAGRLLVEAAEGADLLVLGSQDGHLPSELLLDALRRESPDHPCCPVVIVPR